MWLILCMLYSVFTVHIVLHKRLAVVNTNSTSLLNGWLDFVVFCNWALSWWWDNYDRYSNDFDVGC